MNFTREQISEIAYIKDRYEDNFINLIREILQDLFLYKDEYDSSEEREGQDVREDFEYYLSCLRDRIYEETSYLLKVDIVRQYGFNRALSEYQEIFPDQIPPEDKFVQFLFAHCVFDFTFKKSLYDIIYRLSR